MSAAAGAALLSFRPSATAVAFSGEETSGCVNSATARETFEDAVDSSAYPSSPWILVWKT